MVRENNKHKKVKIGVVSNSTWYTYNFRLGVLKRFKEMGLKVIVIAPKDHYSTKLIAEGFEFIDLQLSIYSKNPIKELFITKQLVDIYKNAQLDFVFHYTAKPNVYGSIAAKICKIPSIAITTGLGLLRDPNMKLSGWVLRQLYRIVGLVSKEIWFLNKDDYLYFKKYKLLSTAKSLILPSEGVNIQWYRPNLERKRSQNSKTNFLFAGRIVNSKGVRYFFEAAKQMKAEGISAYFKMVGFVVPEHPDGISFKEIQEWKKTGIVEYLGEAEDIRPFIEDADCIVLPSFFGEGVPRILLEAASMAKPIITTDFVGCKEVVEHGVNGLLCKPRDIQSLLAQLELFCAMDDQEKFQMGLEGRKKVILHFDEERVITQYIDAVKRHLKLPSSLVKST